jgi:hypothetical protein
VRGVDALGRANEPGAGCFERLPELRDVELLAAREPGLLLDDDAGYLAALDGRDGLAKGALAPVLRA